MSCGIDGRVACEFAKWRANRIPRDASRSSDGEVGFP
jgi:hypothetical protein